MPKPNGGTQTSLAETAATMLTPQPQSVTQAQYADKGYDADTFGPGEPIHPAVQREPRRFDFTPSWNRTYAPRSYEPFTFATLRAFSNVELIRLAIETRKDQLERLDFRVKSRDEKGKGDKKPAAAATIEKFFRKPDGETPFASWLRQVVEDLLTIDAVSIEKRRTKGGRLLGLDVIDGSTIKVLIDPTGRRPKHPFPAYQQVIRGLPWAELTTADLIYAPRNIRTGHVYGFGPVEQLIVTINTLMNRQAAHLSWFTEGNLPAGLATLPKDWTSKQIQEWQEWFNAKLSGNAAERAKLVWAPEGAKYQAFKEAPLKDEFDEWLARLVCFAFSLPPTPFIRQLNRSSAETSDTTALEEGLEPLLAWWKRIADDVIEELGHPDLEWAWERQKEVDPFKQAQIHDLYVKNGSLCPNEVRDDIGRAPREGGDEYAPIDPKGDDVTRKEKPPSASAAKE